MTTTNLVSKCGVVVGALALILPFTTLAQLAPAHHVEELGPPTQVAKSALAVEATQGGQPGFTNFFNTFSREAGATIQTVVPGSRYQAVVTSVSPQRFFLIKVL